MEDYIARGEFDATVENLKNEDTRENKRISELEETVKQINELTRTVDRLATNMEHMLEEQKAQGKRLETLESRDGETWRKVSSYLLTCVAGIIIGFLFKMIGIV